MARYISLQGNFQPLKGDPKIFPTRKVFWLGAISYQRQPLTIFVVNKAAYPAKCTEGDKTGLSAIQGRETTHTSMFCNYSEYLLVVYFEDGVASLQFSVRKSDAVAMGHIWL